MKNWYKEMNFLDNEYRPKIRYWMPHSMVNEKGIKRDVRDFYERGYGSIEVVCKTNDLMGAENRPDNMWGSDAWIEKMKVLLREAKKYGLTVDFINGPAWPITDIRATSADDETTLYELAYGLEILDAGSVYNGNAPLPKFPRREGKAKLVACSLYKIVGDHLLDFDSYIALPTEGEVTVKVPDDGERWGLFAFWGRPACQKHHCFYVIDHFSKTASEKVMDYWENKIFPAFGEDLSVVRSIFGDSLEYRVDLEWIRSFAEDFQSNKGYSIIPYLPVIGNQVIFADAERRRVWEAGFRKIDPEEMSLRNLGTAQSTLFCGYDLSNKELQHKVNFDYFDFLTKLFAEDHVGYMQKRAEKYGINIRYQVAYNKTLETEYSALCAGIPENEAIGGGLLDRFRNMSAAVHLDRKEIYSFECAAEQFNGNGQTHEDLLWWAKRAYSGGMNSQVLHGASYSGYYDGEGSKCGIGGNVTWPGYQGFPRGGWSNDWNRTLSIPEHRYMMDYLARCNYLLRAMQKVDIAIYRHEYSNLYDSFGDGRCKFKDDNLLNNLGYTYEFISPRLMRHKNATVKDGRLDKEGAAYKALVIDNEEYLPYEAALRLKEYSDMGLPLIFIGRVPDKLEFLSDEHSDGELCEVIKEIKHTFINEISELPRALGALRILPDAMPDRPTLLRPVHTVRDGIDIYYVHNSMICEDWTNKNARYPDIDKEKYMRVTDLRLSLQGATQSCEVYEIDGFSGMCTRLASTESECRYETDLHFERDEAKILALMKPETAEKLGIVAREKQTFEKTETLELKAWSLELDEIMPPEGEIGTFFESEWKKHKPVELAELVPWCEIFKDRPKICGVGRYKTSFTLDKIPDKAELCLQNVTDTYTVSVNGIEIEQGDPVYRRTDITAALRIGENTLMISVSSTLYNMIVPVPVLELPEKVPKPYGIWGCVALEKYIK